MSKKKKSESNPRRDPKLRSFLKQAAAIISGARGLNEECRQRLRSLADHLQLTDEQFEEALGKLKQSDDAAFRLNHWEKDFVEQLKRRFETLSQNILKPKTERKILAIAKDKYQISEVRASQLIDHYVQTMGIGRVEVDDAKELVRSSVATLVNAADSISEEHRQKLYDFAETWGLGNDFVDELIDSQLKANARETKRKKRKRLGWLFATVTLAAGVTAIALAILKPEWLGLPPQIIRQEDNNRKAIASDVATSPPSWWTSDLEAAVNTLVSNRYLDAAEIDKLKSFDTDDRSTVLSKLLFKSKQTGYAKASETELIKVLEDLLNSDPDVMLASRVVGELIEDAAIPDQDVPLSAKQVREIFRSNEFLTNWLLREEFPAAATALNEARNLYTTSLGNDVIQGSVEETLAASKRAVALKLWNHLGRTSWASTAAASLLIDDLVNLTEDKLSSIELSAKLNRILFPILEQSPERWRAMRVSIKRAVMIADEFHEQEWLRRYVFAPASSRWKEFLTTALVARYELEKRDKVADILLEKYRDYKLQLHAELLEVSTEVSRLSELALSEVNLNGSLNRPDHIARLAFANNLLIEFEHAIRLDRSLVGIREKCDRGLPVLRKLVGLEKDKIQRAVLSQVPTEFEQRTLSRAVARLNADETATSKRLAMDNISKLAERFADIEYRLAKEIAVYILSRHDLETALNIEKNLTALARWPNLGLALADQLNATDLPMDSVLTLLAFQQGESFEIRQPDSWRQDLSQQLKLSVLKKLKLRLESQPSAVDLDWRRLKILYGDYLNQRAKLHVENQSEGNNSIREALMSLLGYLEYRSYQSNERKPKLEATSGNSVSVAFETFDSELDAAIVANQEAVRGWTALTEFEFQDNAVRKALSQFENQYLELGTQKSSGQRLLLVERWLLQVLVFRQRLIIENKVGLSD